MSFKNTKTVLWLNQIQSTTSSTVLYVTLLIYDYRNSCTAKKEVYIWKYACHINPNIVNIIAESSRPNDVFQFLYYQGYNQGCMFML